MKYAIAAFAALISTNAMAHSGHMAEVDGHTHTLLELSLMGAAPVVVGLVLFAVYVIAKRNNG